MIKIGQHACVHTNPKAIRAAYAIILYIINCGAQVQKRSCHDWLAIKDCLLAAQAGNHLHRWAKILYL